MKFRNPFLPAAVAALLLTGIAPARAQEDSPELTPPGAGATTLITPGSGAASSAAPPVSDATAPTVPASTPLPSTPLPSILDDRIDQRMDGRYNQEPIRVQPKAKKNVIRVDQERKPKIRPVAVIKGPVAPWGYTSRYLAGEVYRPSARELLGKSNAPAQQQAGAGPGGGQPGAGLSIRQNRGGRRERD